VHPIAVTVNGQRVERTVESRLLLSDFLRHDLGLTGTHVGCEHGVCGACTVLVDDEAVRSCLMFAVQADGLDVKTVESLDKQIPRGVYPEERSDERARDDKEAGDDKLHPIQEAFREAHALQCGFCTPGILMTLVPFLRDNPSPSEDEIRHALSGNLCRCTGYANMVTAVKKVVERNEVARR
jgi:aerobic-type carbon monoxide dehydrogenase small subunit (CoxS/CutS family)